MGNQDSGRYFRERAGYHYSSAQQGLDYASEAKHPKLREAWKRVAECDQDLATALEQLAGITDEIERNSNSRK